MSHEYLDLMESVLESTVTFSSFSSTVSILAYVFSALAIYNIAQRRGIRKAWLAWVPVVNVWILGSISDQYRYVTRGEVRSKRKILLVLSVLNSLLSAAAVTRLVVTAVLAVSGAAQGIRASAMMDLLREGVMTFLILLIPVAILSITRLVFEILALYDVYTSCDPANNVIYLVLSLIPGISHVTRPVFLFLCRNQDGGMPPRKPNPIPNIDFESDLPYEENPSQENL